jgi:hypothetical protein
MNVQRLSLLVVALENILRSLMQANFSQDALIIFARRVTGSKAHQYMTGRVKHGV